MFCNYDIKERFSKKNADKYSYFLVDSHYKSNAITAKAEGKGGQKFKAFFDDFCQYLFDINLALGEDIGQFPIVYSEAKSSAQIAIALSCLTPYVMGEYRINARDTGIIDEVGNEKKARSVDFWFCPEDLKYDAWVEVKHLWLNIGKSARGEFDAACKECIKEALEQIRSIDTLYEAGRIPKGHNFKIALFKIYVYCQNDQKPDINELDSIPEQVASSIATLSGADKKDNMGVLLGALDLRKNDDMSHFWGKPNDNPKSHYMPFVLLGAVVMV